MAATTKKALADIFESPSDDEEFLGFGVSEESRDSLRSQTSWKPVLYFRSKFITDELAHVFMDSDSEEEFEGFSMEESSKVLDSEEDSDDIGFYSDDDNPAPQRRQSSGLCVAFRFPARRISARNLVPKKSTNQPISTQPPAKTRKRREAPVACKNGKTEKRAKITRNESDEEDELTEAGIQILNRRAKNIQENKAMLAKLFSDLDSLAELSPKATPTKKKQCTSRKQTTDMQNERRNPSRKARPKEHFGLEEELAASTKPKGGNMKIDLKRLMKVDKDLQKAGCREKRKYRKPHTFRMPEDITEEELENVADRTRDKILDKENGSTCHQCRQKTLDTKTECRNPYCQGVKGQFCGPCLRNRYGEDVRTALLDPTWVCPLCRGVCNCSLCRKKDGRCATGALTHLAKFYGYHNVKEYLESLQKSLE